MKPSNNKCSDCSTWKGPCPKCKTELLSPYETETAKKRNLAHVLIFNQGLDPIPGWDRCRNGQVYVRDDVTRVEKCPITRTWNVYQQCFDISIQHGKHANGALTVSGGFSTAEAAMQWTDRYLPTK